MLKPKRLKSGNTLAIVSPSWGGPAMFPHIYENGLHILTEDFGFHIKEFRTARMTPLELYQNPKLRAEDLHQAFIDPNINGIIASIGGDDSIRMLKYLDLDLIKSHPKFLMGYSDTTSILAYLNLHGLVTYYGPTVMSGLAYLRNFPEAYAEYQSVLFSKETYQLTPFSCWADAYKDWSSEAHTGFVESIRNDDIGHRWLNKSQRVKGKLWGGCFEILAMMIGTLGWPDLDFWNERILFLETSEDKPSPQQIAYLLRNLGVQGILERIQGLLIARPKAYTQPEKVELEAVVKRIVLDEFQCHDLNMVVNLDFGHTDPRHILPYGITLALDPAQESLIFLEDLFED